MKSLFLLGLLPSTMFACLWVDGTTIDGHRKQVSGARTVDMLRRAMSVNPREVTASQKFGESKTEMQSSEAEAVNKVFSGDLNAAITLLKKLEEKVPMQYSTAANLGTAYELSGDNVSALKWITDGMRLNPDSHDGTEWLHALILEAKIEAAKHPEHPTTARLLDVPEKMQADTQIQVRGKSYSAREIQHALLHQLNERLVFVKPKDRYVADLLYSYALIEANLSSVEDGLSMLKLSREYGFSDEELLNLRQEQYKSLVKAAHLKWSGKMALFIGGAILLLYYCYRRKWFFLSKRAYKAHQETLAITKGL